MFWGQASQRKGAEFLHPRPRRLHALLVFSVTPRLDFLKPDVLREGDVVTVYMYDSLACRLFIMPFLATCHE